MGRRKVEIKRIENKSSRQVTFCKRRNGLMEKARQLSILCESSVAVLIVSSTGKLYRSSSGDSMAKILELYEIQQAEELKTVDLEEKARNHLSHKELLEIVQCKLEEAKSDNISVESLIALEEQFKTALSVTRARKNELMMELVEALQRKEKLLREENKVLASQLTKTSVTKTAMKLSPFQKEKIPHTITGKSPQRNYSFSRSIAKRIRE